MQPRFGTNRIGQHALIAVSLTFFCPRVLGVELSPCQGTSQVVAIEADPDPQTFARPPGMSDSEWINAWRNAAYKFGPGKFAKTSEIPLVDLITGLKSPPGGWRDLSAFEAATSAIFSPQQTAEKEVSWNWYKQGLTGNKSPVIGRLFNIKGFQQGPQAFAGITGAEFTFAFVGEKGWSPTVNDFFMKGLIDRGDYVISLQHKGGNLRRGILVDRGELIATGENGDRYAAVSALEIAQLKKAGYRVERKFGRVWFVPPGLQGRGEWNIPSSLK